MSCQALFACHTGTLSTTLATGLNTNFGLIYFTLYCYNTTVHISFTFATLTILYYIELYRKSDGHLHLQCLPSAVSW